MDDGDDNESYDDETDDNINDEDGEERNKRASNIGNNSRKLESKRNNYVEYNESKMRSASMNLNNNYMNSYQDDEDNDRLSNSSISNTQKINSLKKSLKPKDNAISHHIPIETNLEINKHYSKIDLNKPSKQNRSTSCPSLPPINNKRNLNEIVFGPQIFIKHETPLIDYQSLYNQQKNAIDYENIYQQVTGKINYEKKYKKLKYRIQSKAKKQKYMTKLEREIMDFQQEINAFKADFEQKYKQLKENQLIQEKSLNVLIRHPKLLLNKNNVINDQVKELFQKQKKKIRLVPSYYDS